MLSCCIFASVPNSFRIRSDFVPNSFRVRSEFVPNSFRIRSEFILGVSCETSHKNELSFRSRSEVVPKSFRSRSEFVPNSFRIGAGPYFSKLTKSMRKSKKNKNNEETNEEKQKRKENQKKNTLMDNDFHQQRSEQRNLNKLTLEGRKIAPSLNNKHIAHKNVLQLSGALKMACIHQKKTKLPKRMI